MDYLIKICAKLDPIKRPPELPETVYQVLLARGIESSASLAKTIQDYVNAVVLMQNFLVRQDPWKALDPAGVADFDRKWVPMHMILYLYPVVQQISGALPEVDKEGNLVFPEDVVKQ